jgi:hypothetical protein
MNASSMASAPSLAERRHDALRSRKRWRADTQTTVNPYWGA